MKIAPTPDIKLGITQPDDTEQIYGRESFKAATHHIPLGGVDVEAQSGGQLEVVHWIRAEF